MADEEVTYGTGFDTTTLTESVTVTTTSTSDFYKIDMAMSAFFTLQISGVTTYPFQMQKYGSFMPLKAVSIRTAAISTMSIPVGIFRELTFVNGRKLGKLDIVMYDTASDTYEKALRDWYEECAPTSGTSSGYVGYLDDMTKQITLKAYSPQGDLVDTFIGTAIISDDIVVQKNTDSASLKEISFSLAIVG